MAYERKEIDYDFQEREIFKRVRPYSKNDGEAIGVARQSINYMTHEFIYRSPRTNKDVRDNCAGLLEDLAEHYNKERCDE